jgi:alkylation response protein AidB-like acyl-CoA dehydrogenase
VDPLLRLRVIEEISAANGSAGWVLMLFTDQNAWAAGWLPHAVAHAVFAADPRALVTLSAAPPGKAQRVPGGYRVSGRWSFASGSVHASWFASMCQLYEDDAPLLDEAGKPRRANFLTPAHAVTIHDTWESTGLRGTSSHDYSLDDVFVPEGWQFSAHFSPSRLADPAFAYAGLAFCDMSAVSLGIARAAVEAATELVQEKRSRPANVPLREDSAVQAELGHALALVETGRAYLHATVAQLWQELQTTGTRSHAVRVSYRLATVQARAACRASRGHCPCARWLERHLSYQPAGTPFSGHAHCSDPCDHARTACVCNGGPVVAWHRTVDAAVLTQFRRRRVSERTSRLSTPDVVRRYKDVS